MLRQSQLGRRRWTRADAVEVIGALMPPDADPGTLVERVEAVAAETLGEAVSLEAPARSVAIRDGLVPVDEARRALSDREGSRRWTTTGTIEREARAVALAGEVVDLGTVMPVGLGARLSAEQGAAVASLVSSPARVSVLVAPAGAGKTSSLHVAGRRGRTCGRRSSRSRRRGPRPM